MIRFSTLGALDLRASDGRQLSSVLAQPKRVALLAYLAACATGDTHRRDTLLGLFWPDLDESRGRHALNQALYVLRRALGPTVFISMGDEDLALAPDAIWCDAAAFADAAEAGEHRDALDLYGGDLLDGFFISDAPEFEKWLDNERARLRRLAARSAWAVSAEEETAGRDEEAAEWARRACAYSLEDETALRRLITMLDRVGDRASAVRAYEAFAARLRDELGVEPSPETQDLAAAIRDRQTPAANATASRPAGTPRPPLDRQPMARTARARPSGLGEIWEALDAGAAVAATERQVAGGGRLADRKVDRRSVAVLPFVDLSGGVDREYFADGIAEELISALARVEGLRVAARTSSFQFKGKGADVKEIGERLSVDTVLEGSVRMRDDRVRITVQLVDARDGFQIWSERYDRQLADIFSVQEEIACEIVDHLRTELVAAAERAESPIVTGHTEILEAYTLYLKGRYLWNQRTAEGLRASIQCFEESIALDPAYARAYAGLADAYSLLGWYRYLSSEEAYERIRQNSEKALELQAFLPEALTSHAYAKFIYEWDFPGAEVEFRRALGLNAADSTVRHWYGEYLMAMGRLEQAHEQLLQAHALDPLSLTIAVGLGWSHYFLGEYRKAIERYEGVAAMDPEFVILPWFLGPAYVQAGRYDDAIALYEEWLGRLRDHPGLAALLAQAHALAGREDEARAAQDRLEKAADRAPIFPDYRALVHTALGEDDAAFEWLEAALEERCWVLVFLRVDPAYERLRSDPRFGSLAARIGLPS